MSGVVRKYDVFFSYNWRDRRAVEAVGQALRKQGLTVFLDRWYLVPGRPWPEALEKALNNCHAVSVFLGPYGMGGWQQREKDLALNRQSRDSTFPVIPVLLPGADPALGFLCLNTWVDMQAGIDDPAAFAVLAAAVRRQSTGPELQEKTKATLATICPYRGLQAFREEDSPLFFGREAFTKRLAESITQHTMIAVVGASGSGKSSVVRAGLVPYLRKRMGDQAWDIATLVPGDRPLHALAAAMVPVLDPERTETDRLTEIGKMADYFAEKSVALRDVVARILEKQPGTGHLLLVVDQWEELYTLVHDDQIRERFFDELLEATKQERLTVVLTLRGDFFGRVLAHRALADRLQDAIVNLGPMTRKELEHAIETPAEKVGLTFEAGLVGRILDDVKKEPGSLPLLEFVLTGLWERRRAGLLLHQAYEAMGEVRGAMAQRADEVFAKLSTTDQKLVRRILMQLVRPGEGTDDTRRRATFTEVGEAARPVVQQLADARLTVTSRDETTGEETFEVAHEALIHNWTRLKAWMNEDREFLIWRQRLRINLEEWERNKHEKGTLLRGAPLVEAKHWLSGRIDDLNPTERDFIENSAAWQEQRRHFLSGVVISVITVLSILTAVALWQRAEAKRQQSDAEAARYEAERQAETSKAVSDFLREDLLASMDPYVAQGREVTVRSFLDAASAKLEGKFEQEPLVEASIRQTLGATYRNIGDFGPAEKHLDRAYKIRLEQLGEENPDTLETMEDLARVYWRQGRYDKAQSLFTKTLEGRRQVLGEEHPDTLRTMNSLAVLYFSQGRYAEAESLYTKMLQINRSMQGDDILTVLSMNNLATVYRTQGRYSEAEPLYIKATEKSKRLFGEEHPDTLHCMNGLAMLYIAQHRYDEAEPLLLKVVDIEYLVLGEEHPDTLYSLYGLGVLYTALCRYEEAEDFLNNALSIGRLTLGEEHPTTCSPVNGLAWLYYQMGRYKDAETLLIKALQGRRLVLGDEHPDTFDSMHKLAMVYTALKCYEDAEPLFLQAQKG